jgi:S-adenosylmethionine-diacylgycerolhomoserine-N-methlytransferase
MLFGREELIKKITVPEGGIWVEFGSGTGYNVELLGEQRNKLKQIHLVDLCPSLMNIARAKIEKFGWNNVQTHLQDATTFAPTDQADVVLFSYSLTLIPDWFAAIDNAKRILKPGGIIASVDYHVSRNHPGPNMVRHNWSYRTYAPTLFARNNVTPNPDHVYYLQHHFQPVYFEECQGAIGRLLRVHYYQFIGRK